MIFVRLRFPGPSTLGTATAGLMILACLTGFSRPVSADDNVSASASANVGALSDKIDNAAMEGMDITPDLFSGRLIKILPGDWLSLDSVTLETGGQEVVKALQMCPLSMHLEQPDPLYPIFQGREAGVSFQLRLKPVSSFVKIDDMKDLIHLRRLDDPKWQRPDGSNPLIVGMMQTSVTEGALVPANDDVLIVVSPVSGLVSGTMIRCAGKPEDAERTTRDLHLALETEKRLAAQKAFLSMQADGSSPFQSKVQGSWTFVDEPANTTVRKMSVDELCRLRRVDMRADHKPLPILTAHVADATAPADRPVPASDDEFDLRLIGDHELLRVALHDPLPQLETDSKTVDLFRSAGTAGGAAKPMANRMMQKMKFGSFTRMLFSSAMPVNLVSIDDDTLVETPIDPWGYPGHPEQSGLVPGAKRIWLRCPSTQDHALQ